MSRSRSKKNISGGHRRFFSVRRFRLSVFILIQLVCIVWMGALYYRQSPEIRDEIRATVKNYFENSREIRLDELLADIRRVCEAGEAVELAERSGDTPFFAGRPKVLKWTRRLSCQTLKNRGYWCGYDNDQRNPLWVAYTYKRGRTQRVGERPAGFETDLRTRAKVTSGDYVGSGFDRGHMAPNHGIALYYGKEAQAETFLMSNITPQRHDLNAGIWKELEILECGSYVSRYQQIWVMTGPVFNPDLIRELPSGVPIPEAFYKIIVDEMGGRMAVTAFIIPQTLQKNAKLSDFLVSVNEIEKRTGLDFFTDLSEEDQEKIESRIAPRVW